MQTANDTLNNMFGVVLFPTVRLLRDYVSNILRFTPKRLLQRPLLSTHLQQSASFQSKNRTA